MYTGIIYHQGKLQTVIDHGEGRCFTIEAKTLAADAVKLGDSIAVNGVCLTAVTVTGDGFTAHVSPETLAVTTLGHWQPGQSVNLELSLLPNTPLGGHFVSGHVDGKATLIDKTPCGEFTKMHFQMELHLAPYVAKKGSVCLDGVSLTVNEVGEDTFSVMIIPHTLEQTQMHALVVGQALNLEVDVIARYLERLLARPQLATAKSEALA